MSAIEAAEAMAARLCVVEGASDMAPARDAAKAASEDVEGVSAMAKALVTPLSPEFTTGLRDIDRETVTKKATTEDRLGESATEAALVRPPRP